MQNEMLMDDSTQNNDDKNYNSWEMSGDNDQNAGTATKQKAERIVKTPPPQSKQPNKNSAAKAESKVRSAIGNTNPNVQTGLSDGLRDTGTNVAYTESED